MRVVGVTALRKIPGCVSAALAVAGPLFQGMAMPAPRLVYRWIDVDVYQ